MCLSEGWRVDCVRGDVTAEEQRSGAEGVLAKSARPGRGRISFRNVLHEAQEASKMMYDQWILATLCVLFSLFTENCPIRGCVETWSVWSHDRSLALFSSRHEKAPKYWQITVKRGGNKLYCWKKKKKSHTDVWTAISWPGMCFFLVCYQWNQRVCCCFQLFKVQETQHVLSNVSDLFFYQSLFLYHNRVRLM